MATRSTISARPAATLAYSVVAAAAAATLCLGGGGGGSGGGGGGGGAAALAVFEDDALAMGGIHAGYDWQRLNWVYGIEGDIDAVEDVYDYVASIRGRIGWATENVLLYATTGVAFARNDSFNGNVFVGRGGTGGDGNDGGDGSGGSGGGSDPGGFGGGGGVAFADRKGDNDDDVGFVIGSGMDVKLSERFSVGMEGLFYAFDDDKVNFFDGDRVRSIDSDNDFYVVRARLTYHLQ